VSRLPRPGELGAVAIGRAQQLRSAVGRSSPGSPEATPDRPAEPDPSEYPVGTTGATAGELAARERKLSGWGGQEAPELSPEQAAGLQEREEPVAAANFGAALSGDLGSAEVADEAVDAPETVEPDTQLGPRADDNR